MRKKTTIAVILLTFFYPLISNAGWFSGPDNYDDCMLEKMKGQDKSMRRHAMRACEELFPYEKEIPNTEYSKIETTWRQNGSTIEIIIEENLSNYNISKIKAGFSTKRCSEIEDRGWIEVNPRSILSKRDLSHPDYTLNKEFIFRDEKLSVLKKIFASENWKTTSVVEIRENQSYNCMKINTIWGYRKK